MKILVTGGAGFIGSHVVDRLTERGDEVVVIDNLSSGRPHNLRHDVTLIRRDLADPGTVALVRRIRPDILVHCAAQTSVPVSVREPSTDARSNILGGINTLVGAAESDVRRFVYVTTGGALYGETKEPATEDHPIRPASPYGVSKWVLESYMRLLLPPDRSRAVLRLANVYGPRQLAEGEAGVVSVFCHALLKSVPLEIHGDGLQTRDFVFVGDVADAVVAAVDHPDSLTVNIGSGSGLTIRQLYFTLDALVGHRVEPSYVAARPGDVRHSVLDSSLARALLDWVARTTLRDGLDATVAWHREMAPETSGT